MKKEEKFSHHSQTILTPYFHVPIYPLPSTKYKANPQTTKRQLKIVIRSSRKISIRVINFPTPSVVRKQQQKARKRIKTEHYFLFRSYRVSPLESIYVYDNIFGVHS